MNKQNKTQNRKLNVMFIHNAFPAQFGALAEYLHANELANTFVLTNQRYVEPNQEKWSFEILGFKPDDVPLKDRRNPADPNAYYYSGIVERAGRKAIRIVKKVKEFLKTNHIDIIVSHGSEGPGHFLFDEVDVPIITYIEFPCYRTYGHDAQYPWHTSQKYRDKNFEMLSIFQSIKSDLIITPSIHSLNMFPDIVKSKVVVQMEGFDPKKFISPQKKKQEKGGPTYIGYVARGLSSAKGFEHFIKTSQGILKKEKNVKFIIIGDPKGPSYGYEKQHIKKHFGNSEKSFKDYILEQYKLDEKYYEFTGLLDRDQFTEKLSQIDIFLYPLQFGAANRGFFNILMMGKKIIASDRCFIPEVITHNKDALICPYNNIEKWVETTLDIISNSCDYSHLEENAKKTAEKYSLKIVANNYLDIFDQVITKRQTA